MKLLNQDELNRLDRLYCVMDIVYRSLRDFVAEQRKAIATGDHLTMHLCDAQILSLSLSLSSIWGSIQRLTADPVPEPTEEMEVEATGRPN